MTTRTRILGSLASVGLLVALGFGVSGTTGVAQGDPGGGHVKGVDPGADATNNAGYKQALVVPMHTISPEEAEAAKHPKDLLKLGGGGCTIGYGNGKQCLPIAAPNQMPGMDMPWTCPDVRDLFPNGLKVLKANKVPIVDPLHLDLNADGVACGPGD